jgi:hypothetical protein
MSDNPPATDDLLALAKAMDDLKAFLNARPEIPRIEKDRFLQLDQAVYSLAVRVGLNAELPKQHEVERPLYHPSMPDLPPVMFLGKTNLPYDLSPDGNSFMHVMEGRWEEDMLALRACVEDSLNSGASGLQGNGQRPQPEDEDREGLSDRRKRPCFDRDHAWLAWYDDNHAETYHSPANIRDKWNRMGTEERKRIAPKAHQKIAEKEQGMDLVKKGIAKARQERNAAKET